ncbi:hypothetical protein LMH87_004512 [Akanthomyces muscarius]|uniref:Uncharacterized protein n=1 Tax=Akanthomyces muscarius TaxID=2231603 RepID=A0A9W8Q6M3_AKAMU|nr:hypothetical protein LMH87_004512 [Akanthomyces muscarius]KAJ4145672.1 hypothetical protein LMH87_004512 [Akanthomyces muscarius]
MAARLSFCDLSHVTHLAFVCCYWCPHTAQSDCMINNAATQLELSSLLRENIAEYISTIDDEQRDNVPDTKRLP